MVLKDHCKVVTFLQLDLQQQRNNSVCHSVCLSVCAREGHLATRDILEQSSVLVARTNLETGLGACVENWAHTLAWHCSFSASLHSAGLMAMHDVPKGAEGMGDGGPVGPENLQRVV